MQHPRHHGSVCLGDPRWKGITAKELWNARDSDTVFDTDKFAVNPRSNGAFFSFNKKTMCPSMAEVLFMPSRNTDVLTRKASFVRPRLIVRQPIYALSTIVYGSEEALVVACLFRADGKTEGLD